jgi:transcriptional regulator of acetoin/glycerol metabolism
MAEPRATHRERDRELDLRVALSGDLPESLRTESATTQEFVIPPHRTLAEIEKMAIVQTLHRTNWNKQEAAQILGLYRPTLYSKMKKHEIQDAGKNAARRAAPV